MNYIPRQVTRSAKYTPQDPEVRGVCGFLTRVKENSRFEITMSKNRKMLICGKKITSDTVYPALKYNLPKNYDLLSMTCLCAFHHNIFNKAFEKHFFNFDHAGHTSPASSISLHPSQKKNNSKCDDANESTVSSFFRYLKNNVFLYLIWFFNKKK